MIKVSHDNFFKGNKCHRICYIGDAIYSETFLKNGKIIDSKDKPSEIVFHPDGKIKEEIYYLNGEIHRGKDKPAIIEYYKSGAVYAETFCINGLFINGSKPYKIHYYESGEINIKFFERNFAYEMPHTIEYYKSGKIYQEIYPTKIIKY